MTYSRRCLVWGAWGVASGVEPYPGCSFSTLSVGVLCIYVFVRSKEPKVRVWVMTDGMLPHSLVYTTRYRKVIVAHVTIQACFPSVSLG